MCGKGHLTPLENHKDIGFLSITDPHPLKNHKVRERSDSVVECLTGDRGAAGSSLTVVTALWSLSKTHLSKLSTGSTHKDSSIFK